MKGGSGAAIGRRPVWVAVKAVVVGSVCGAALCAVLLALCALAFVSSENLPHGFLPPFILAVSVLSAGFAGFVTARISRRRGLIFGVFSGLLLFLLFLVSGLIACQGIVTGESELRLLVMALAGGVGGFLAVNGKSGRK